LYHHAHKVLIAMKAVAERLCLIRDDTHSALRIRFWTALLASRLPIIAICCAGFLQCQPLFGMSITSDHNQNINHEDFLTSLIQVAPIPAQQAQSNEQRASRSS
jgi:hypothetical protein